MAAAWQRAESAAGRRGHGGNDHVHAAGADVTSPEVDDTNRGERS